MYTVSARNPELVALRLLLLHIPGCTQFQDLRTVNNVVHDTFVETTIARGLHSSDQEFSQTIEEALLLTGGIERRKIFACLHQWNQAPNAPDVWHNLKDRLCQDIRNRLNCTNDEAANIGLYHIQSILHANGAIMMSFAEIPDGFVLPANIANYLQITQNDNIGDDDDDVRELLAQRVQQLNPEQRSAYNAIVQNLQNLRNGNTDSKCHFVDGPGGTGKTFLYETVYYYCVVHNFHCVVTAWTGIAATLLPTGRTGHSVFKLPLYMSETTKCNIEHDSPEGHNLRDADIILWDECSMVDTFALTAVDNFLRESMRNSRTAYSGKVIVMGGDFRQILPVVKHGDRSDVVLRSIVSHSNGEAFNVTDYIDGVLGGGGVLGGVGVLGAGAEVSCRRQRTRGGGGENTDASENTVAGENTGAGENTVAGENT
ncbi:hypothetical protein DMENIID0001_132250 [Sergentomyia squamirostris]